MSDAIRYAIVFVFVTNAVAIAAMTFLVMRLTATAEDTREMLRSGCRDLLQAGRGMRDIGSAAERLMDRLALAEQRLASAERGAAAPAPAAAAARPALDQAVLDELQTLLRDLAVAQEPADPGLLEELRKLLDSLKDLDPAQFADWQRSHQRDVERLSWQRARLGVENEQLKERLELARKRLAELGGAERKAEEATQVSESLRVSLDQYQQQLQRTRERASSAEERVAALVGEMDRMKQNAAKDSGDVSASLDDIRLEIERANKDRDTMARELQAVREAMDRMAIEKDFIEQKFLGLDDAASVEATA